MSICRKISALALGLALAACTLAGCGESTNENVLQEETTPIIEVGVYVSAPGADASSSPAIIHIAGGEVDFYHASPANTDDTLELAAGEYAVEVIAPINADGSTYEACETKTLVLEEASQDAMIAFDLVLIESDKVTAEALEDLLAKVAVAVSSGDETLCGDAGLAIIEAFQKNAKAAPQSDEEKIEEAAVAATGAVAATPKSSTSDNSKISSSTNAGVTSSSSNKTSSTSPSSSSASSSSSANTSSSNASSSSSASASGNTSASEKPSTSSGGSSSTPAHTHSWTATYKTVNHEAVYETVYHPAVYKTVTVCKGCGEISPSEEHLSAHISNHTGGGTRGETIKVSDAWEETVCVSEAWSEQVVTGYTCSCGATKAA